MEKRETVSELSVGCGGFALTKTGGRKRGIAARVCEPHLGALPGGRHRIFCEDTQSAHGQGGDHEKAEEEAAQVAAPTG